jgi:hypothetical protein
VGEGVVPGSAGQKPQKQPGKRRWHYCRSKPMELQEVVNDIGCAFLNKERPNYHGRASTQRMPDLLIRTEWAVEFKIARPFGDNGKETENCR